MDKQGNTIDAPVLRIISKGKGPGPDGFIDTLLYDNEKFREELFERAYEVFNEGRHIQEEERNGKLMLLSKTLETNPDPQDTRPIVIMNTFNKLIQAILLFITEERLMNFVDDYQLGFRKGSSTQH